MIQPCVCGGGGEFYGRHTPYDEISGPFTVFLQENDIVAQYSTPGEPQQNRVAKDIIAH
jgi:hypothetical protein